MKLNKIKQLSEAKLKDLMTDIFYDRLKVCEFCGAVESTINTVHFSDGNGGKILCTVCGDCLNEVERTIRDLANDFKLDKVKNIKINCGEKAIYATVADVMVITGKEYFFRPLHDYCDSAGLNEIEVFTAEDDMLFAYPYEAWKNVYNIDLTDLC